MKKKFGIIFVFLIILFSVAQSGCIGKEKENDDNNDNYENEEQFLFIYSHITGNGVIVNGSILEKEETIALFPDSADTKNKLIYLPNHESIIYKDDTIIKSIQIIYSNVSCPDYDIRGSLYNFSYTLPQNFCTVLRGDVWHNITVNEDNSINVENNQLKTPGQTYNYTKLEYVTVSYSHAGEIKNATIEITYQISITNFGLLPISNIKDYDEIYY